MAGDMPKRVLFIGNSYTFYWNLPQTVSAMARSQDIEIACRQSTGSGATLQEHWNSEKDLKTLDILREGDFDAVVLQEHSTYGFIFLEFSKHFFDVQRFLPCIIPLTH